MNALKGRAYYTCADMGAISHKCLKAFTVNWSHHGSSYDWRPGGRSMDLSSIVTATSMPCGCTWMAADCGRNGNSMFPTKAGRNHACWWNTTASACLHRWCSQRSITVSMTPEAFFQLLEHAGFWACDFKDAFHRARVEILES